LPHDCDPTPVQIGPRIRIWRETSITSDARGTAGRAVQWALMRHSVSRRTGPLARETDRRFPGAMVSFALDNRCCQVEDVSTDPTPGRLHPRSRGVSGR